MHLDVIIVGANKNVFGLIAETFRQMNSEYCV